MYFEEDFLQFLGPNKMWWLVWLILWSEFHGTITAGRRAGRLGGMAWRRGGMGWQLGEAEAGDDSHARAARLHNGGTPSRKLHAITCSATPRNLYRPDIWQ